MASVTEGLGISRLILQGMLKEQLKDFLRSRSLPVSGNKEDLINRILQHATTEMHSRINYFEENEVAKSKFYPVAHSSGFGANNQSFDLEQGLPKNYGHEPEKLVSDKVDNVSMDMTNAGAGKISVNLPSHAIVRNTENNEWLLSKQPVEAKPNSDNPTQSSHTSSEWLIHNKPRESAATSYNRASTNDEWLVRRTPLPSSNIVHVSLPIHSDAYTSSTPLSHVPVHHDHNSQSWHEDIHSARAPIIGNTTPNYLDSTRSKPQELLDYAIAESIEASKMPLVEPCVFEGDMLSYNRWSKSFDAFINKRKHLSASDKLFYLEKYTSGEARELIEHYLTMNSDNAYDEAMKDLGQTYGNDFLIAQTYKRTLANWSKIAPRDNVAIKKLSNFLKQCKVMKIENPYMSFLDECDRNQEIVRQLPEYLMFKWNNKVTEYQLAHNQAFPPFTAFVDFMAFESKSANNPVTSVSALREANPTNPRDSQLSKSKPSTFKSYHKAVTHKAAAADDKVVARSCPYCNSADHNFMSKCQKFKALSVEQRINTARGLKACNRCLSLGHFIHKCKRDWSCGVCKSDSHHTLLHKSKGFPRDKSASETAVSSQVLDSVCNNSNPCTRLFSKTVPVWLSSHQQPSKEILTYALLDDHSNKTYVTNSVLSKLEAAKEKATLKISTMTASNKKVQCDSTTTLRIRGFYGQSCIQLPRTYARSTIPCCNSDIPTHENVSGIQHLSRITQYIPPKQDCSVGLLVGRDCFQAMAPIGDIIPAPAGGACAVETQLGWYVVGPDSRQCSNQSDEIGISHAMYSVEDSSTRLAICCKTVVDDITPYELMRMIDGPEFVSTPSENTISQEDVKFLDILDKGVYQDQSQHYVMPLPFRESGTKLTSNSRPVLNRFYGLLSQFKRRGEEFKKKYTEFVEGIISRGEAEPVPKSELESREGWFLPHHGVHHKKTGKIRVVFDCSAQANGVNLNDELLQGPDLNNSLLGVLLRFRQKPVALCCDIEKMYHRFRVVKEHRDYLRFFWLDSQGNPAVYRMCVHIFGARSSPNCAKYGLNKIATDYGGKYPQAQEFIQRNFYVDDGLCSVNTCDEAIKLLNQTRSLCKNGNLHVHKLLSNQPQVLEAFPQEDTNLKSHANVQLLDSTERALGMLWALDSDAFTYKYQPGPAKEITRRSVLANVASVYDPMGLICPLILPARVLIQSSCKDGLSWDQKLDLDMCNKWKIWDLEMSKISSLSIPRCIYPHTFMPVKQEIHTFADASELGYGACSYIRSIDENNAIHCSLMLGKTRVAPLKKHITIPRLELQAALLAARQLSSLKSELGIECNSYLWSDSKIVLGYINNDSKRFQTFVANRVSQILELSSRSQWDYVNTSVNPADIASRGSTTVEHLNNSRWFHGPEFLWKTDPLPKSNYSFTVDNDDSEVKKSAVTLVTNSKPLSGFDEIVLSLVDKSSSWNKTVRCVAMLQNIKSNHSFVKCGKLSAQHIQSASNYIISLVQSICYQNEIQALRSSCEIDKSSSLWRLDCFIDSDNLLRVGGRVRRSSLSLADKNPIVIPKQCNLSKQILRHYHELVAHQGRTSTMSAVRSAGFWVVGLSNAVSSLIYTCSFCRRLRRPVESQKMADLPAERVEAVPPFTHVGCDVFGPFPVKDGRKYMKRYGLIITCMSSRAVHIETLDDLSTDCFLQSWRCFVALRGNVSSVRCDNGTNFVGANNEILKLYDEMSQDSSFTKYLQEHHCHHLLTIIMSSSKRLKQVLDQYRWSSQYPDIRELTQLLSGVAPDDRVSILKNSRDTLSGAAERGHTEIITTILSSVPQHQRLDVLLVDDDTPLHDAAHIHKSDCAETILTHLTPEQQLKILSVKNSYGWTAAEIAGLIGHEKTEGLLIEYQKRAEQQMNTVSETDNDKEIWSLTRELHQTKAQLENQAKDIQMLVSAVTELYTSNKNKDEILQKITEESRELKSTVQDMKEEISRQTTEAAKYQTEIGQQREQILQQQTEITNLQQNTTHLRGTVDELGAAGDARGWQHQQDITSQKLHYETKLTEKQEQITRQQGQITRQQEQITRQQTQITRQQTQIDVIMSTVNVRNLAICDLNDRSEVLGAACTNLREDVDRIDETVGTLTGTVERIDDQFYPESNAVGRGAPHDGGDEMIEQVIEELWTVPQPATN